MGLREREGRREGRGRHGGKDEVYRKVRREGRGGEGTVSQTNMVVLNRGVERVREGEKACTYWSESSLSLSPRVAPPSS